ncbi:MAG: MFS transporter [Lentisphaeria bacterium]|nr:MFS transporter [Lentisphaeria bacterium]
MKMIPRGVWQLAALMLLHFTADMVGGILPGILPVLRENFNMTLSAGVVFLAARALSSNFCQMAVGPLRKNSNKPFFIYIGLILLMLIGVFGLLPKNTPAWILWITAIIFGCGTAVVHPEGLRGAMAVKDVNGATATALFMTMGFFGFSCGPLIGALLVEMKWGLKSLLMVAAFLLLVIIILLAAKITLLTDKIDKKTNSAENADTRWSFAVLFIIAFFMNSGSTMLQSLLPTFMHDINNFSLKIGGIASLLFGLGSATGSIAGGIISKKVRPSTLTMCNLFSGMILLFTYFAFSHHIWALGIMFFAGFTASSSLPLLVVMARFAPSKIVIGLKMGIMVGGSWGAGGVILLGLSMLVEKIGLKNAMWVACSCYLAALLTAVFAAFLPKKRIENK